MYVLLLNDMRSPKIEMLTPICRAETKEELEAFISRERVEPYKTDEHWHKVYRQGGPLEWFNEPYGFDAERHFLDVRTENEWVERARRDFNEQILPIPMIGTLE